MLQENRPLKFSTKYGGEMKTKTLASAFFIIFLLLFFSTFFFGAIPAMERAALIALYNSTNGDNWTNKIGWKNPPLNSDGFAMPGTEGTWYGITVLDGHVTKIVLYGNSMSGNIPPELGNLTNLSLLQLDINQINGGIPSEIGGLINLEELGLSRNKLSGNIPTELGNLRNLRELYLFDNQLSGSIPVEIGALTNLEHIWLDKNKVSGNIPSELGNLRNLKTLSLSQNQLSGSIPLEIGGLVNLYTIYSDYNNLSGNIPPELGNLGNLRYLHLSNNQLSGSIPSTIGNLTNLESLRLGLNNLTGSIPTQLGNLKYLSQLLLYGNQLSGSIPSTIGYLVNLAYIDLGHNNLSGNIPKELSNLRNLTRLALDYNQLSGSIPIEIGGLVNLKELFLYNNQLSGHIPSTVGSIVTLENLNLYANKLSGPIPTNFMDLVKLRAPNVDIGNNCLYTNDSVLKAWLHSVDPDWKSTQNACGPIYTITIISPNGGESWTVGSVNDITWMSTGGVGDVKIDYSYNNGGNWLRVISSTANDGNYTWTVPDTLSSMCKIKISEVTDEDGAPTDESNATFSIIPRTYTLNVKSSPENNIKINVNPNDIANQGDGITDFSRTFVSDTNVTLTAPESYNGKAFLKWVIDSADKSGRTIETTMNSDHTAQVVYRASTYALTIQSSPDSGASITVTPPDNNNRGNGNTAFIRTYNSDTIVTLTTPSSYKGNNFLQWLIDGSKNIHQTIDITMNKNHLVQAIYQSVTSSLTVQSSPYTEVGITVSPADKTGNGNGSTRFTRTYNFGTTVTLTAPSKVNGYDFIKWIVNGQDKSSTSIQVNMEGNQTAVVYYKTSNPPELIVNRKSLKMGYIIGSDNMPQESFVVYNNGGGTLNWTVSTEITRVSVSPVSGTNYGVVEVTMDPVGLSDGNYRGVAYVSDPVASDTPVEIEIKLWVKANASPPFGEFSTPADCSTVSSSVPVTGWALGDTGIDNVKIYREDDANLVYIGDALLVEGARPDVEAAYSDYPMNYKAGWGYMMLTHFLPNGGNGIYKIHAVATDKEGLSTTLGIKTITIANATAVKPFGAIDFPAPGGTASGNNYRNHGWVLTPPPNKIPENGSTINAYVDGKYLGHPAYNLYRPDIAALFPEYVNVNGAGAYFDFDTTPYENGVHTIYWTATDNAGNSDGIGSRYFTIQNTGSTAGCISQSGVAIAAPLDIDLSAIPLDYSEPVKILKGFTESPDTPDVPEMYPNENGFIEIEIKELERVELHLTKAREDVPLHNCKGYLVVNDQLRPLPIGSTLDSQRGIFYWQPGPGFVGKYHFTFIEKNPNGDMSRRNISVVISPKHSL